MAVDIDPRRRGRLRVIGNGAQRHPGAAALVEPAHQRDPGGRYRRRRQLFGRDRDAGQQQRLGQYRQRDASGHTGESQRGNAPHHRPETDRHHDRRDDRVHRQSPHHDGVEGNAERGHRGSGENHRAAQSEAERIFAGGRQQSAKHDPLAEREIDHARGFVDEHKGQRDQRVNRAGERALDQQGQEEVQNGSGDVSTSGTPLGSRR